MGMTTQELGVQLKAGKILAKDMVPKLAKALRELAAPGLEKALKSLTTTEQRMLNTWVDFKNQIFTSGLGTFLQGLYTTFSNLLIMMKPLANILGGIFDGIQDVLYPIEYMIALFLDWATYMGYLDSTTQNWAQGAQDAFKNIGQVIGWVLGVWGVSKAVAFAGALGSVLTSVNAVRIGLMALVSSNPVGLLVTGMITAASLIWQNWDWLKGKFVGFFDWVGERINTLMDSLRVLKNFFPDSFTATTNDLPTSPTQGNVPALNIGAAGMVNKQPSWTTSGSNSFNNGLGSPTQPIPITFDVTVKGDVVEQHVTKAISLGTTAQ